MSLLLSSLLKDCLSFNIKTLLWLFLFSRIYMHLHFSLLIFHSQGVLCSNPCYYLCVPKGVCQSIYSDNSIKNHLVCCKNIDCWIVHKINEAKTAVWHHDFWAPGPDRIKILKQEWLMREKRLWRMVTEVWGLLACLMD
jgi:hypothetical protein